MAWKSTSGTLQKNTDDGKIRFLVDGEVSEVVGEDGKSAYEVAVENGFEGTEEQWLASLIGPKGDTGDDGAQGPQGPAGPVNIVSDLEMIAGTDDAKAVTALKTKNWWTDIKTKIQTFAEIITFTKMPVLSAATANYFVTVDATKQAVTKYQPVSPYITDVTVQGYLSTPSNWNGSGIYVGPAIVQTQGAIHKDSQYQYEMFDPTTPTRKSINGGTEHLIGNSGTPSISAGVGAGTSPTIAIAGNDIAGRITLTTGTSPTADGIVCTVTFNRPRSGVPRANVTPRNKAVLNLCWVSNETTTTFVVSGNLAASTQYILNYIVAQ